MLVKLEDNDQREIIFHSRCLVNGRFCNVIFDGSSCNNVAIILLVVRATLKCVLHCISYKLHWLDDNKEISVTKEIRVPFSVGKYEVEALCDVVPMQARHLLLGGL